MALSKVAKQDKQVYAAKKFWWSESEPALSNHLNLKCESFRMNSETHAPEAEMV
jgi:hypothetical protein